MALTSPTFLAVVLTLLAIGVMSGTQAKPVEQSILSLTSFIPVPVLDITSSIKLDKPMFGLKFGPFTAGQELTLTCSTKASDSVSLSWWEGDTEQQSSPKVDGLISNSFTIQTLRIEDNGRRFSCRDQQTQAIKHIEISVETGFVLEITKDGKPIENGAVVQGTEGEEFKLNCIVQGYNPFAVSWWEGGAELESVAYKSDYGTSNVLSVEAITVDDSRRTFTCRSSNGQMSKTVTLEVHEGTSNLLTKDGDPIEDGAVVAGTEGKCDSLMALLDVIVMTILFIVLLIAIIFIVRFFCNKNLTGGKTISVSNGNKRFSTEVKDDSLRKTSEQYKGDRLSQKPLCQPVKV